MLLICLFIYFFTIINVLCILHKTSTYQKTYFDKVYWDSCVQQCTHFQNVNVSKCTGSWVLKWKACLTILWNRIAKSVGSQLYACCTNLEQTEIRTTWSKMPFIKNFKITMSFAILPFSARQRALWGALVFFFFFFCNLDSYYN